MSMQRKGPPVVPRPLVCNGRALDAVGLAVGEPCGNTLPAKADESPAEHRNRARARRWKLGPDGNVMCPSCGRPDPDTAKLCRELELGLR